MSANLLHLETSPYLLQHAKNPVHWRAWNKETLSFAKQVQRLMIVSVGYSACHWCHVMEHESFEDKEVADVMNRYFVNVKVDREERPDVDGIYMDACQLVTGRGGWPLNAITLPDGRPVYAGTYYPKQQWLQLLRYFAEQWQNDPQELIQHATQITQGIRAMDAVPHADSGNEYTDSDTIWEKIDSAWDYQYGGRRGAPKFPMPVNLRYMLRLQFYNHNPKTLLAAQLTADKMFAGGIYDHVGGGFARYSVDERWEIPHFEKMLYDNAQLLSFYAELYQIDPRPQYRYVIEHTFNFLQRELSADGGGFYAALDADSEGEEGKYYVWSITELKAVLGQDFDSFSKLFKVSEQGNFEHHNHLTLADGSALDSSQLTFITGCMDKLLQKRLLRVKPGLDDKILTSWNALTISGLASCFRALGDVKYLSRALACAEFLCKNLIQPDGSIYRNFKNNRATISGFLDDYSFSCEAFLDLYEITLDERWLHLSQLIASHVIQHFYNASTGLFFYTSVNDDPLIARKTETSDNVIPSSNSSICKALYRLSLYTYDSHYEQIVMRAVKLMQPLVAEHPAFYANWATLTLWMQKEPFVVAILGDRAKEYALTLQKKFMPNAVFSGAMAASSLATLQHKYVSNKTLLYACRNKTCSAPVEDLEEILELLKAN